MSKSKYPNQIDTSAEIPTVRDNITEIGSDVLNSFKSAIIAIEKTLGINPQGSVGNTVASRLSRITDSEGNLLSSAITQAGILSGPITDNEVSAAAAISESKLDLNFPTHLLQDEISILQGEIEVFNQSLANLSARFSVHINTSALNRHPATAISVASTVLAPSNTASLEISADNVQEAIEEIYNSHINYSGSNITIDNNSHLANQIFFDNTDVEDFIPSENVQDAIEDLADLSNVALVNSLLNLHSNGLIRAGRHNDKFNLITESDALISASEVTYSRLDGVSRTTFVFGTNPTPTKTVNMYDTLVLAGSVNEEDNASYQISEINLDTNDAIESVEVYGGPLFPSASGLTAIIYKNKFQINNPAGLLTAARPRINRSNTPDVQIANPNSAVILSDVINVNDITETNHTFNISIDGGTAQLIETYDENLGNQTVDSIINKINEQFVDLRLNLLAYKYLDSRFALVHNLPNFADDVANRTLKVSVGSSNDGTEALGLNEVLDILTEGSGGNTVFINGKVLDSFGNIQIFNNTTIELIVGTSTVSLIDSTFAQLGVRVGDLLVVDASTNSNDYGQYRIDNINSGIVTLDTDYTFQGTLGEGSVFLLRCTAPIGELTFAEIDNDTGIIIFDIFIDELLDTHYAKRLEIDSELRNGGFISTVVDVSKGFLLSDQTATLDITTQGMASLTGPDGNNGAQVYVGLPGDYILLASDGFSFITLRVGTSSLPTTAMSSTIYGFNEVSRGNLLISRGVFSTYLGRVIGYSANSGIPVLVDKRNTGTIGESNISKSLLEKYIEGPRNELRGSGIIRGCLVQNIELLDGYQTFDVSAGIAIVNGIRVEFPGKVGLRINSESSFYVAINYYGSILFGTEVTNPDGYTIDGSELLSPFFDSNVADLAAVEEQIVYDLRLFVDHLDYKVTNKILVSNDQELGHFTNINDAIGYAKRFSNMWEDAGTPNIYIREGLYEVDEAIIVDFDVKISGSGPSTIIRKTESFAIGSIPYAGSPDPLASVFYIGNKSDNLTPEISRGVVIENITYELTEYLTNVGSFINLAECRGATGQMNKRLFQFKNLIFIGNDLLEYDDGDDENLIGEYAIVVGFANTTSFVPVGGEYGNIIIADCLFNGAGIEKGPCLLRDAVGLSYNNIIASRNIGKDLSPNLSDETFEIFQETVNASIDGIIESSNIIQ